MPPPPVADDTRARLLEAAGPLFAQHGFRDTGVKEICDAAGCNVAAINYHFGGKQEFYAAVLEHAHRSSFSGTPMPRLTDEPATDFRAWIGWWMRAMFATGTPQWLHTLIAREMVEPTPALDGMVERSIGPMYQHATRILRRLLGPRVSARRLKDCMNSVVGQVLLYKHCRPVLHKLGVMPRLDAAGLEPLIEHVVAFSLGGIAAFADRPIMTRRPGVRRQRSAR